jgi:uncharacterized protein
MHLIGQQVLPCSRETAWAALFNPEVLKACIPGCEEIEKTDDNVFRTKLALRIGPVSARFSGMLTLVEQDPPNSTKLQFEGNGGVAGFGKGEASITLTPANAGCILDYSSSAHVGGRLAQIGSRLVDATAAKLSEQFFSTFIERLSVQDMTEGEEQSGSKAAEHSDASESPRKNVQLASPKASTSLVVKVAWVCALVALAVFIFTVNF